MKYHIKSFSPFKTALHVSAFYFVVSLIASIMLGLLSLRKNVKFGDGETSQSEFDSIAVIFYPFKSAILGFVAIFIACFAYNKIAARLGGIELEFMESLPSNKSLESDGNDSGAIR